MTETPPKKRGRPPKAKEEPTTSVMLDAAGWYNALAGLGSAFDKSTYTRYGSSTMLTDDELTALFMSEGLANRIIEIIPSNATKEWIWVEDETVRKPIMKGLSALATEEAMKNALIASRLYGGAIMIVGAMDGRTVDQPLNEKAVRSIEYLKVVDKTCVNLQSSVWDMEPSSPTYGKIIKYSVRYYIKDTYVETMVHYTRVIEFKNDPVPSNLYAGFDQNARYWGMSSLQPVYSALKSLGSVMQNTENLLLSFNAGTYKFKNLGMLLASQDGNEAKIVKRLQAIEAAVSSTNSRIIDAEESYQKDYASLSSIDQLLYSFMLVLCGVVHVPITVLFGQSPSGFSSGSFELVQFYDLVESYQRNRLTPALDRLIYLISLSKKLPTEIEWEFNSLYQVSEKEKADIAKTEAETAKIQAETELLYIENGIRDGAVVAEEHGWGDEYEEPVETKSPSMEDIQDDISST